MSQEIEMRPGGLSPPFFAQNAVSQQTSALPPLCNHGGLYQPGTPSSTAMLRPSTCCAKFAIDTQGQIPLYSHPSEASSITSPHLMRPFCWVAPAVRQDMAILAWNHHIRYALL